MPGIRGIGRVCRIRARSLYRALGTEHIPHRRDVSPAVLMRHLFSLDYLMEHATCLASRRGRDARETQAGIPRAREHVEEADAAR